ncbi:Selenocysteine-specific elongation factor [Acipenser ruthenus]|uniref:Selenocysteine-specific elongation factor n=1 Tax=Acipenser ruthenus TaxID=7906 RepID=A0A444UTN7_ACIRT|nr:Selenocysteine-specific elongation factor [Acipenser ruthenus]
MANAGGGQTSSTLNFNIGVLGHIDSGKTSLAKALSTTASTAAFDKNPQSKERGITLDLGFSSFTVDLPIHLKEQCGQAGYERLQFTLVDCPGHASLIRTIIGGAQIIDLMLLVVDVMKGVQTQTAECLVIGEMACPRMVVVLNKTDLLPAAKRQGAIDKMSKRLHKTLENTRFHGCPIIPVAAKPGGPEAPDTEVAQGVPELIELLKAQTYLPRRDPSGPFLMAVDHCFSIRGQGTVMTGTVLQGAVSINDSIEIPALKVTLPPLTVSYPHSDALAVPYPHSDALAVSYPHSDALAVSYPHSDALAVSYPHSDALAVSYPHSDALAVSYPHSDALAVSYPHSDALAVSYPHSDALAVSYPHSDALAVSYPHSDALAVSYPHSDALAVSYPHSDALAVSYPHSDTLALSYPHSDALIKAQTYLPRRDPSGPFLMAVDHCFSIRGQGTVMTGTVLQGAVSINDSIEIPALKVADDYTVIGRNLFKKETNIQLFVGLKVTLSTGERGVIEGGFGQSGKMKIRIPGE